VGPVPRRRFLAGSALALAARAAPSSGPLRIGQIGTTHAHAAGKLAALRRLPEHFEIVGVVEPDPARRAAVAGQPAYRGLPWLTEEALFATPGLRAVTVETVVEDLVPTARRCVAAGLHVHLDKPAGPSLPAFRELLAAAGARGLTVQLGYMFRYNPGFVFLRRAVREGWLGDITEISGGIGKLADAAVRRDAGRFAGGGMFELGCHLIDQVVSLLGPPAAVNGVSRRLGPPGDPFADNQLALLEYPRALVTIRCNHTDPLGNERRGFAVTGTRGTAELRPLEPPRLRLGLTQAQAGFQRGFQDVELAPSPGRYDGEFLDLVAVVRGGPPLAWDAAHDLAVHAAVLRASGMA
jgi:predicted dehydrogenase